MNVPTFLGVVLLVDLALATTVLIGAPAQALTSGWPGVAPWAPWAVAAFALAIIAADVRAGSLSPGGITWRRRLGFVAMAAVVWRGGLVSDRAVQAAAIVWLGVVWVALVVGGRTLSRAIASVTGEDKPE